LCINLLGRGVGNGFSRTGSHSGLVVEPLRKNNVRRSDEGKALELSQEQRGRNGELSRRGQDPPGDGGFPGKKLASTITGLHKGKNQSFREGKKKGKRKKNCHPHKRRKKKSHLKKKSAWLGGGAVRGRRIENPDGKQKRKTWERIDNGRGEK